MVTGSLQTKNGKYYAVINLRDENGKRKIKWVNTQIPVKGGSKKQASAFLDDQLFKWNKVKGIGKTNDFAAYLDSWLTDIEPEVRPNTYRGYCNNIRNHVIPYFKKNKINLEDVTPIVLEDYYFSLLKPENNLADGTALSPTTIRHHHQNISKALNDAVRRGLINSNPASSCRLPKSQKFKGEFLNDEQLDKLNTLFKDTPLELPVFLTTVYGFRRSEVLGLKWKNVDFAGRRITICETLNQHNGGNYVGIPKTDSSYRTMPMTERVCKVLTEHKIKQDNMKKLIGNYYVNTDYVCTHQNGEVISPNYLTREFHSAIVKSDLPPVRFHDLRHSVASNLLNNGFSIVQVMEWLGHSSPEITLRFYAHVDKTSKTAIASAINRADAYLENNADFAAVQISGPDRPGTTIYEEYEKKIAMESDSEEKESKEKTPNRVRLSVRAKKKSTANNIVKLEREIG